LSLLGHSLPIHLAPVPANVRYYPNSDLSRRSFATHSARKRVVTVTVIRVREALTVPRQEISSPLHLHKTRSARRQRQPHGALASSPLSRQSIVNWGGATWATRHVLAKPMPKVIDYYFMIVGVIVGSFVVAITFGIPVARWLLQ